MEKPIGGFFELELGEGKEFIETGLRFNFARHAIAFYFKSLKINRVHLPAFICTSVPEVLKQQHIAVEYYNIKKMTRPVIPEIGQNEGLVVVNHFGMGNLNKIPKSLKADRRVLLDNSQGFFARDISFKNCVYSPRKFFGIPDGAYLQTAINFKAYGQLPRFESINFTRHLIARIEYGPEDAFNDYKAFQQKIKGTQIEKMSFLSQKILRSIDYKKAEERRHKNFMFYRKHLDQKNRPLWDKAPHAPLIYPLYCRDGEKLRKKLIEQKIFVPQYWPQVLTNEAADEYDNDLTKNVVCLPIDQRYIPEDLEQIVTIVKLHLK